MSAAIRRARAGATHWWIRRTPRERILVEVMGAALLGYLLIAGAARPMRAARADALERITRADMALSSLRSLPDDAGAIPEMRDADQSVTAILTSTGTERGLEISRIEPENGGARLTIDSVDFADLLQWIETLETDYGLSVASVEMDRRPEPGVVRATLAVLR